MQETSQQSTPWLRFCQTRSHLEDKTGVFAFPYLLKRYDLVTPTTKCSSCIPMTECKSCNPLARHRQSHHCSDNQPVQATLELLRSFFLWHEHLHLKWLPPFVSIIASIGNVTNLHFSLSRHKKPSKHLPGPEALWIFHSLPISLCSFCQSSNYRSRNTMLPSGNHHHSSLLDYR